jgi:hypothetical protein
MPWSLGGIKERLQCVAKSARKIEGKLQCVDSRLGAQSSTRSSCFPRLFYFAVVAT